MQRLSVFSFSIKNNVLRICFILACGYRQFYPSFYFRHAQDHKLAFNSLKQPFLGRLMRLDV